MKRREFVAAFASMFAVVSCGSSDPVGGGNPPAPPPPPPPPPAVPGADVTVGIEDNAFVDPAGGRNANAVVTIQPGQTVGWRNGGVLQHTVTSMSVPAGAVAFDSGNLGNDDTFTVTPTVAGTYTYRCDNHPQTMVNARIEVQ